MLYGLAPSNVYETAKSFKENFVEKEKLIEKKYYDLLEEIIIKYYKGFEHGKVKPGDVKGKDIDRLYQNAIDYIKRLKELRGQIEKRIKEKEIEVIYKDLFDLLDSQLKKKSEVANIKEFENTLVKQGKFPKRYIDDLKFISKIRLEVLNKKNLSKNESKKEDSGTSKLRKDVDLARKKATEINNALIEYAQRSDFLSMDRARFIIKGKKLTGEIFFLEDIFVVLGTTLKKIEKGKLIDGNPSELEKQLLNQKNKENKIDLSVIDLLKKEFGEFELVY
jgi:hypothetical protein